MTDKISSRAIMDRLDVLAQQTLLLNPRPLVVYKPRPEPTGAALKVGYRVARATKDDGSPATYFTGGCFLEIVPQIPSENEFAAFDWKGTGGLTVKLGLPDLSAMLLAYRKVRDQGSEIPERYRPVTRGANGKFVPDDSGMQLALVHKNQEVATVIKWSFDASKGSFLEITRGKGNRRSISLTLSEELLLVEYLKHALSALVLAGV